MKSVIKVFVYVFISFCIADTVAKNHVEMQTIIFFGLLLAVVYELSKVNKLEEKIK
ncbi:hypothetical protein [Macrococcoides caseolyticum]|uniref:hypothetical protein n=1 Tax=Macrococcoides caseolyticum TaxID=69966 RepID=UPI0018E1B306|nr:hypothetical protein [Macrococcus caseolyticus]QQB05688.1 hypothetical protein I6H62_00590 [Macrococcus caseolyticus]